MALAKPDAPIPWRLKWGPLLLSAYAPSRRIRLVAVAEAALASSLVFVFSRSMAAATSATNASMSGGRVGSVKKRNAHRFYCF
jgi:hypothetical protein